MADKFAKFAGIIPIERAHLPSKDAPMTLEEYIEAEDAVEQALKFGNYAPLRKRLRTPGAKHLPLELSMGADIIPNEAGGAGGGFKRPRHRPTQSEALQIRYQHLAFNFFIAVTGMEGSPRKNRKKAVAIVAEKHKVSPSTVNTAIRANSHLFNLASLLSPRSK